MNLRRLYEHLDAGSRRVLSRAADETARDNARSVSVERFLLGLLRDRTVGDDTMRALERAGAEAAGVESVLAGRVAAEPKGPQGALPRFDQSLATLLREAWSLTFEEYGESQVRPVRFFETLVRRGELWPALVADLPGFDRIDPAELGRSPRTPAAPQDEAAPPELGELARFGRDLTAAARAGELDPVVGLEPPIRAAAAILLRRTQSCPVIVGESGVGKTACATGLVAAMAAGRDPAPRELHDTSVWAVDLSALRAGAVVRGAIEERLQAIASEAERQEIILLLDDLHLLLGDQSSGGADALRAILSRGGVRILGTCGWKEWRRHVEPDPGLARRMAPVRIGEPDAGESIAVLEGMAEKLSGHHGIPIDPGAVERAVALTQRYVIGRRLPDKAIAALDSACARARIRGGEDGGPQRVGEDDVASVVSDLTGVPIGTMVGDASRAAAALEDTLRRRVVGQDDALVRIAAQARAYLAGLADRRRPVGALLFVGPSGVGKTESAHALADALFGGRLLTINMSEYQEAHTVSGLKGAPAGYVGFGEGGVLTEGIRRTPYCVVLLDEIEKAHRDVVEMFYQVLDRGWMEDAEGIEADFSNALIVLTTNAADADVERIAAAAERPDPDTISLDLTRALSRHFPAAFLGRLEAVPYWPLPEETLVRIAGLRLDRLSETYRASHRATLGFDESARAWLAERARRTAQGARALDGVIARGIRPVIADHVLDAIGREEPPGDITVSREGDRFLVRPTSSGAEPAAEAAA